MRLNFASMSRPKKAAQQLTKHLPGVQLALAQHAIARASGYINWHEIERTLQLTINEAESGSEFDLSRLATQVKAIAEVTSRSAGDIVFALSRSHLNGSSRWSLEQHKLLLLSYWRQTGALQSGRLVPGSVVRVTGNGRNEIGYLCSRGKPSRALLDRGSAHRADFEITTPSVPLPDFLPSYLWLPYGYWTLSDGTLVAFSREYMPLWQVHASGVTRLPPWLWIENKVSEYRFSDGSSANWYDPDIRQKAIIWLAEQGISGLPMLADTLTDFITDDHNFNVRDAVRKLAARAAAPDPVGPWHFHRDYSKA